ncbi:hypothetical protein KIH27_21985 [Mycobacterium sp. M1]|uniref:Uncharacterized protein n=1 Tax=Mycolicibacter acidiphilus TaxID=2835306 RepID=A0ABS5RTF4_9MYCO|nr:hypothetical protein [Mycolicibacter acidiphilus]MBS9536254.1 hypothetical protein [Mycolicibacter acidiphilus]
MTPVNDVVNIADGGIPPWLVALIEMPDAPLPGAGADPMSDAISAVAQLLPPPLAARVQALRQREGRFADNLRTANREYGTTDDEGQQVLQQAGSQLGQIGGQLGQLGSMSGLFPQTSNFASLMQPALQAAQGGSHAATAGPALTAATHPSAAGAGPAADPGMMRMPSLPSMPSLPQAGHGPAGAPPPPTATTRPAAAGGGGGANSAGRGPSTTNLAERSGPPTPPPTTAAAGGIGRPGAGTAPVGAGGGMGPAGLSGKRDETGGHRSAMRAVPLLEYDLSEGDSDDDWGTAPSGAHHRGGYQALGGAEPGGGGPNTQDIAGHDGFNRGIGEYTLPDGSCPPGNFSFPNEPNIPPPADSLPGGGRWVVGVDGHPSGPGGGPPPQAPTSGEPRQVGKGELPIQVGRGSGWQEIGTVPPNGWGEDPAIVGQEAYKFRWVGESFDGSSGFRVR